VESTLGIQRQGWAPLAEDRFVNFVVAGAKQETELGKVSPLIQRKLWLITFDCCFCSVYFLYS
jgi:hypothetical protein